MPDNPLTLQPVYEDTDNRTYTGQSGDYMDVGHSAPLELTEGTISLSFSASQLSGERAIISKDGKGFENGGHLTVYVIDGTLVVRQQSDSETEWLKVPDLVLSANTTYHLAVTFGDEGLKVWLNGELVAAEPQFKQGMEDNDRSLVIGGSRAWRDSDDKDAHSLFEGEIGNVLIFDEQLGESDMLALTQAVDPALDDAARMDAMMEDLLPVLGDIHHGSDTLKEIMAEYGADEHGHLSSMPTLQMGTDGDDDLTGGADADGINGGMGNDQIDGAGGDDILQGDYGNDTLSGGAGNDILDGGHGEDYLDGGAGDDLLISRADGREGEIYEDPDRDEGDPYNELTNGKLYPDQPIPADDVMVGGDGADIFYFQTLINAKERYIEKHTRDDGTINWHGVAGENDKLHDHWVDIIGAFDTVMDFDRSEGDRIVIEGHTTEIAGITYGDINGDGIMDHSVIELYSEQGNGGGAHADDRLGNITVYGDLVKESDIEHTAKPAYGIVHTIDDLDEAITPKENGTEAPNTPPPTNLPDASDVDVPGVIDPVLAIAGNHDFSGEEGDYMDVGHSAPLELTEGTISLSFSASQLSGERAIISKDGKGFENGGHLTVYVIDGTLVVRQQSDSETEWLKVPDLVLSANTTYHLAVTFGDEGLKVWLNGELVAAEPQFKQGMEDNDRSLVIGGSRAWRDSDDKDAHSLFEGEIGNVLIFDEQLGESDMLALTQAVDPALDDAARMDAMMEDLLPVLGDIHHGSDTLKEIMAEYGADEHGHLSSMPTLQMGTDGDDDLTGGADADGINGGMGNDQIDGAGGDDILQGDYGNDTLSGGAGNDILDGGHGEDYLDGGAGDDLLISRADGREGEIYEDPDRDEGDPYNELTNGKLYPDQPIPADDVMVGGDGADIFYFQTLINAKERYIEKHTRDDGTINWHGVAGENDKLHDHWVDIIGAFDTVMDFDRSEGDRIVIEGHTTEIAGITYGDINGDGIMDHSVIELYSEQGNGGGAHADDRLGNITVYGDLVKESDIEHTAKPAYGIVHTIDDLDEAITPKENGTEAPNTPPPTNLPRVDELNIQGLTVPVFAAAGSHQFTSDERAPLVFEHSDALDLVQGTIAFNFVADELPGHQVLFSKDASGYGDGGHVTAYLNEHGDLTVRVQDQDESYYLKAQGLIEAGTAYDFALTFGEHGVELILDGARVAMNRDAVYDLTTNTEYLVVGASGWNNSPGEADKLHSHFNGTISDFVVFDEPFSAQELRDAGFGTGDFGSLGASGAPTGLIEISGTGESDTMMGTSGDDRIIAEEMDEDFDLTAAQVFRLYQATLGRDPDIKGLMHWCEQLMNGDATLTEIAGRFAESNEFAMRYGDVDDDGFVTLLYQNVLGRLPDPGGFAHWTGYLNSGQLSRAEVVQRFSESPEFVSNTEVDAMAVSRALLEADFSDDVFRLYQATLGRMPDTGGFENWTEKMADGLSFKDAVSGFMGSTEFSQTYGDTSDPEFVKLLYANILGRDPDAAGEQTWLERLQDDWSREDVVAAMAQSVEFRANSADDLTQWMRTNMSDDLIDAGSGDNTMLGGIGADTFVFRPQDSASSNVVLDWEPWDFIDLTAFNYTTFTEALAMFSEDDDTIVFQGANVTVVFENAELAMITQDTVLI